jgi:hypothetical protein
MSTEVILKGNMPNSEELKGLMQLKIFNKENDDQLHIFMAKRKTTGSFTQQVWFFF